jgi:hypothetical protein
VEAALDLQDESVRRYKAYARRKTLCTKSETLEISGDVGLSFRRPNKVHADPELR